ncbi:hypothetical protein EDB84DRAFT_1444634 [Lactarius hengduanensis]|nr:hypothetical protein EDB84DRAFT_1444634 [Lactarius hengduanensis]
MTSELTLSSLAWLTASVTMRDIPFAVSEQPSVAKGKMKEYYIRTLRMVSDEADVVLLVLPARDTTGAARGKLVETSDSCVETSGAWRFIVGHRLPPEHRQGNLTQHPQARKTHAEVHSVASQLMGCTNGLQSVHLERVLRIVDSPDDRDEGIQGQNVVFCALTQRGQTGRSRRRRCVLCSSSHLGFVPTLLHRMKASPEPSLAARHDIFVCVVGRDRDPIFTTPFLTRSSLSHDEFLASALGR